MEHSETDLEKDKIELQRVADREMMAERLQSLQAKLSNAMDLAHLAPWELDVAGGTFTFNDHFYKLFRTTADKVGGYTMSASDYARRFVHPNDLHLVDDEIQKAVETTDPDFTRQMEHRIVYPDGSVGYIIVRYFIVKNAQGQTVKINGVNQDITDRKRSEKALKESENLLRTLIRSLPDLVWLKDQRGVYLSCNSRFEKFFGATEKEIIGKTDYDFLDKELADSFRRHDQKAVEKGKPSINEEEVTFADDGHREILETIKTPMFRSDGTIIGVLGIGRDITKRKMAESALWQRIEFERLISKISSELAVADAGRIDQTITQSLAAIGAFTGADRAYIFQTKTDGSRVDNTHEWCAGGVEPQMDTLKEIQLFQKLPWFNLRIRKHGIVHIPDVSALPPEARWERVHFESQHVRSLISVSMKIAGRFKGFVGFDAVHQRRNWGDDEQNLLRFLGETFGRVLEHRQAEEALRESEEKLMRSKKMESLGLLAGGVAHDLNNILSGIVSYPELMLMDLPPDSNLHKPIKTIQACGNKAVAIVQDLLTLARGVAIEKQPLNLNDVVNSYLESPEHQKLLEYHSKVTVAVAFDSQLMNINGSVVHIGKAIMNLVSNAAEAIVSGGRVVLKTMSRYLDRPLKGYDDVVIGEYAVLSVSDNGSGISSDDIERIFEPFYTKKEKGRSGTGLGLAVVWNVVRDHKGYINVSSDGRATTFELYFPATRDELWLKDQPSHIGAYDGDGETVLVIDDEKNQREIFCKMLDMLGYESVAVSSGEQAVKYLESNRADLILLDMILGQGINGRETFEQIKKFRPNQKAVIVSGFAETDDVKIAQQLGAGPYLRKPVRMVKLAMAIKEELAK